MYRPKNPEMSIKRAVLENAASPNPRSPLELAAELGVRPDSVYECISRLRRQGRLKPSDRQTVARAAPPTARPNAGDAPGDGGQLDPQKLLIDLASEVVLSDDDRRRVLSRLARVAPGAVQVQAIRALEDMDRQQGRQVGPPPPSTDEEMIYRAARVLECVGRRNGEEAIMRARVVWDEGDAV